MKILVIDNYDSFVYNLVHYLKELRCETYVVRNDQIDLESVPDYDKVLLSPGPGIPEEAGQLLEVIRRYGQEVPMLGVCLGHQAIGQAMGAQLVNLETVYHGVATKAYRTKTKDPLFEGIPDSMEIGRYHSWVVDQQDLPEALEITSRDDEGRIMSMRHRDFDLTGVQFHPESVLTPDGKQMIRNWIQA